MTTFFLIEEGSIIELTGKRVSVSEDSLVIEDGQGTPWYVSFDSADTANGRFEDLQKAIRAGQRFFDVNDL